MSDVVKRAARALNLRVSTLSLSLLVGLAVVWYRNAAGPSRLSPDALKIWKISSGQRPGFSDRSFSPVAAVYRAVGLGDAPLAAGMIGFLIAAAAIFYVVLRSPASKFGLTIAIYVFASMFLSAWYLGQYSKDVFVVPVALILVVNRRLWWDVVGLVSILTYMYFFRDYWAIVAVGYVSYRIATWVQVRIRYYLLGGVVATALIGLAIYFVQHREPAYYRTKAVEYYEPTTALLNFHVLPEPINGVADVVANYVLLHFPAQLPVTAGFAFIVLTLGMGFLRLYPLYMVRSAHRWPERGTLEGTVVRRALSMLGAFVAVQAIFEPDYGSVLRHLTPLLSLSIALLLSIRSGHKRVERATPWNWTGSASGAEMPRRQRAI